MNPQPTSILVIESHPLMRAALCEAITAEMDLAVVASVSGGAEALVMAATHLPDVILFSVASQSSFDLETLSTLHRSLPAVPILALTANEEPGEEALALEAGARIVLNKTVIRGDLLKSLRNLIPLQELKQENLVFPSNQ